MTRRFGRNRRRRMRAELADRDARIAAHKIAHRDIQHTLTNARYDIRRLEEFCREVAGIVGKYATIAGEPIQIGCMAYDQMRLRMYPTMTNPFDPRYRLSITSAIMEETLRLLYVDAIRDVLRPQIHVTATLANGHAGYFISQSALLHSTPEQLAKYIAPQIAYPLARKLKELM